MITTDEKIVADFELVRDMADPLAPYFTGWKPIPNGVGFKDPMPYIGQITQWLRKEKPICAYVCLPGMEAGIIEAGVYIGEPLQKLYAAPTTDEMAEMFRKGLNILRKTVDDYEKGNPCTTE